ncbi:MAG: indolepyruvate ferredoxin oxidoreductase subunit alpha [Thermoplasmata archaeon]|nr:MAG: indolepyruvate ferredoxin oxidoreductase subunit alpha [Thermoplasmata archaeon]
MSRADAVLDAPGTRVFLTGNEAIARGFLEAGVGSVSSYPGTPSTEITETLVMLAKTYGFYTEWSVNEKVASEVAIAASISGLRAVTTMKGVGVNVASEPFHAFSYMGVRGGLVLVDADDPGCHSSHTEQDNRYFGREAHLPVLEVGSQREAKDMAAAALVYSEEWGQPVILRTTTRIGHSGSDVVLGEIARQSRKGHFLREPNHWVNLPANARRMRAELIDRIAKIQIAVNDIPFNSIEGPKSAQWGFIISGAAYGPAMEALSLLDDEHQTRQKVRIFKLATPFPLPTKKLEEFIDSVENVLVVEELEPFVEEQLGAMANRLGYTKRIHGKDFIARTGELSTMALTGTFSRVLELPDPFEDSKALELMKSVQVELPVRAPILCAGCGHRSVFYAMNVAERKLLKDKRGGDEGFVRPSDIGCYTLGFQPPLTAVDTHFCMGASIGVSTGFAHFIDNSLVATIGDSTFFHAGMPPVLNAVFNRANITAIILDNQTTAMTGHQPHPGVGSTASGEDTVAVSIAAVVKALGVEFVREVNTKNLTGLIDTIMEAVSFDGPAVIVAKGPCIVKYNRELERAGTKIQRYYIDEELCTECGKCLRIYGCPAMYRLENDTEKSKKWKVRINSSLCNGCGTCGHESICKFDAIKPLDD